MQHADRILTGAAEASLNENSNLHACMPDEHINRLRTIGLAFHDKARK